MLRLKAKGWHNARIAKSLCIAESTVKNHVSTIYTKPNVSSRAEPVAWAWQQELIEGAG